MSDTMDHGPVIKLRGKDWHLRWDFYGNGRLCMRISSGGYGSLTASVNMPEVPLGEDQICIKNYSENEGVLDALVEAGVVSKPLVYVRSGFVQIPVCTLLFLPEHVRISHELRRKHAAEHPAPAPPEDEDDGIETFHLS